MNILLTHELFPPEIYGGGEKLAFRLATELQSRGHSVKVVTSGDPTLDRYKGVETMRIPVNRYAMNLLSIPTIIRECDHVDVVQASMGNTTFPSYISSRIRKRPVCCWVHHILGKYWTDVRGPILGRVFRKGEKFVISRNFDAYVFQNKSSEDIGKELGVSEDKIYTIRPGIDYKKFSTKRKYKRRATVLHVGNFSMNWPMIKTKGIRYLIEAAEKLPNIEFKMLGNYKVDIGHPENVSFMGVVEHKELVKMYHKAGVFVCSSLNEGFGQSILEAMASGCAIVSTIDIGQEGKIVSPGNSEELEKGIRYYIENPKKAEKDGRKNRRLSKRYTWKSFADGFEKLYNNLNKSR